MGDFFLLSSFLPSLIHSHITSRFNVRLQECQIRSLPFCRPRAWYKSESESRSVVSDSLQPRGLYSPWNSTGQKTGVGSLSLLRGIFPTQRLNPGLLQWRLILYQLCYEGSSSGIVVLNSVCTPTSSEECKFEDNKPHTYSLGSRSLEYTFCLVPSGLMKSYPDNVLNKELILYIVILHPSKYSQDTYITN